MATIVKTASGTWKAMVRRQGWPAVIKTFRLKRDAEDWARGVEDEMIRGVYIARTHGERLTLDRALDRYLAEVTTTKKPSTQRAERRRTGVLRARLGSYALAEITPEKAAAYRDAWLADGGRFGRAAGSSIWT